MRILLEVTGLVHERPGLILAIALLVISVGCLFYSRLHKETQAPSTSEKRSLTKTADPNKARKPGEWFPVDMSFPDPPPFANWSRTETKPILYRPFSHKYNITMGIRSLDLNNWIELDNEWDKFHNRKLERLQEKDKFYHGHLNDKAYEGLMEALELVRNFVCARYPSMFKKTKVGLDIPHTGESFDIYKPSEPPEVIIAKLLQDDFAIMVEHDDGVYYLDAGCILLAGFWRLSDKIGLPLEKIHTSGDVPKYKEKLDYPMAKFFTRLRPDKPVARNNYFIQVDDDVAWSHAIGDESNPVVGWYTAENATDINKLHFRSERQTVRRLPKSGVIMFTIRTYFTPVTEICKEPYVPGRLLDGIKSWTPDVAEYKGLAKYQDILLPYLEKKRQEQLDSGLKEEEEDEKYPF
ncbi:hypothetical protein CANCADRAFT_140911 [Tortispora caseinolytica NRRL Y-17796]|uniref:Mannosyl transferase n=1 Tax=Tortispora caseinolytica NRRL Y-17796 TaxID=767744 RepID=A0A1E4TCS2_9ASCO|nr:hypothetical protein CANCADRAFT_140911 [Tortispora caseinolytica NRRL Y-17796]